MNKETFDIDGPALLTPDVYGDERGFFVESYQAARYEELLGVDIKFVQDNVSQSKKGVLRGLHFQKDPHAQGKLVSVLRGSVFDVAVDIRPDSATYGKYVSVTLDAPAMDTDGQWQWPQFWIPPGFAHGFLTLEDDTLFSYKCSGGMYAPDHEGSIIWNDPDIGIAWPAIDSEILVSEKDATHPALQELRDDM